MDFSIEWKDGWRATYDANVARWEKELRPPNRPQLNSQRMAPRLAVLLIELLERYPQAQAERVAAYRELIECMDQLRHRAAGNYYRRKLVESGALSAAETVKVLSASVELLERELDKIASDDAWVEYAAERLLALARENKLADEAAVL